MREGKEGKRVRNLYVRWGWVKREKKGVGNLEEGIDERREEIEGLVTWKRA